LRIGNRVEQHELLDAPCEPFVVIERKSERDPAAERVADDGEIVQILILDELGEQLGLIQYRVAPVERLVRLAEAFQVYGDDSVGEGKLGRDVLPSIGARAEAVDEEHRRALA